MKITLKRTSPNYRQKLSTINIMQNLMIAVIVLAAYSVGFNFIKYGSDYGIQALLIYVVAGVVAFVTDLLCGKLFKRNDAGDNKYLNAILSPLATGLIFALTLPIGTPLYVVGVGSFIAIFFGKAIFGGFGQNIFNPALVGRVFVHLSFSSQLLSYLPGAADAMTGATPTAALKATHWLGASSLGLADLFLGNYQAALGEACTVLILILGVFLIWRKVIDARIPLAYLGTTLILAFISGLVCGIEPLTNALTHIAIGGVAFGAVFMATDPVTSPTSPLGKIIYGIFLGAITMIIRLKANYPEGVLFSILIMNMLTPLIDNLTTGRTNQKTLKQIIVIAVCFLVSAGTVGGISTTLKPVEEKPVKVPDPIPDYLFLEYKDGTYIMQVKGFGGDGAPVKLAVTISGDKSLGVTPVKYKGETAGWGADLLTSGVGESLNANAKAFYDKVIAGSVSADELDGIDTATGATYTAKAVVNAIKGALEAAPKVEGDLYTFNLTANGYGGKKTPMKLEIVINKATSMFESVKVIEANGETSDFGADMIRGVHGEGLNSKAQDFYDKVLNSQVAFGDVDGIDTATGATMTATGIVDAMKTAMTIVNDVLAPNADGAYVISANGYAGASNPMKIEVKVSGDTVEYVKVLEANGETSDFGADMIRGVHGEGLNSKAQDFYDLVLNGSFSVSEVDGIDTATGATKTANGIMEAVKKAIAASN